MAAVGKVTAEDMEAAGIAPRPHGAAEAAEGTTIVVGSRDTVMSLAGLV